MKERRIARAAAAVALGWFCAAARAQVGPRDAAPEKLLDAAATRPVGVRVYEIGKSAEGRSIRAALVAAPGPAAPGERPRLVVVAGLAADDAAATVVADLLPARLLDLAAADPAFAELLKMNAVEIVPALAVDALAAAASRPTPAGRRNARPVDDDRDGALDEDGPNDLDGDGLLTSMRVPDPLGPWRTSDEDPRLMVRADPLKGERGAWRLEPEGLDDDGDGRLDEDGPGGVAFDRNFPHGWKEFDAATGTSAVSEPETRLLADRVLATKPCVGVLVLGRRDNLVEAPPGGGDGKFFPAVENEDRPWFEELSRRRKDRLGFAKKLDDAADGAFHQWAYAQLGLFGLASKVYEAPAPEQAASLPTGKKPESDEAKRLLDSDRRLGGRGFVPWKPYQHPTLGEVEIGGFVPGASETPTAAEIPDLVDRHARFVFDVLALFPRVEAVDVATKPLGPFLYEATLVIRNTGRTPTSLRVASRTRTVLPSRLEIDLPRDAFELGEPRTTLEPFGPSDGRKLRFIVRATPGTEAAVRLWTEKAGRIETKFSFAEGPR